jgi:hypothetical protein
MGAMGGEGWCFNKPFAVGDLAFLRGHQAPAMHLAKDHIPPCGGRHLAKEIV